MASEISTLLAELKEQVLYLQELGVENFNVDLPELSISSKPQVQTSKSEISQERLERFVPTDFQIPKVETPKENTFKESDTNAAQSFGINQTFAPAVNAETKFFYTK